MNKEFDENITEPCKAFVKEALFYEMSAPQILTALSLLNVKIAGMVAEATDDTEERVLQIIHEANLIMQKEDGTDNRR